MNPFSASSSPDQAGTPRNRELSYAGDWNPAQQGDVFTSGDNITIINHGNMTSGNASPASGKLSLRDWLIKPTDPPSRTPWNSGMGSNSGQLIHSGHTVDSGANPPSGQQASISAGSGSGQGSPGAWSGSGQGSPSTWSGSGQGNPGAQSGSGQGNSGAWTAENPWPNLANNLPAEIIGAPVTMEEVYEGSLKALLVRNVGNYVVATFLIGTQTTVSWEGILYDVGNDYLAIYQSGRDQYIVSDLYSLKYVEFYDTRRRQLCDELLSRQGNG